MGQRYYYIAEACICHTAHKSIDNEPELELVAQRVLQTL